MKIIKYFNLDTSNVKQGGERRPFEIIGDAGAVFTLEIKQGADLWYNFNTGVFGGFNKLQSVELKNGSYNGYIKFPSAAVGQQYDIYLFAESSFDTNHDTYKEVRNIDNSIDINSSTGSNSNIVQKVIRQTLDVTMLVSLSTEFDTSVTAASSVNSSTTSIARGANRASIPFTATLTSSNTTSYTIVRQPVASDFFFQTPISFGDAVSLDNENNYPAVSDTDVVDGDFGDGTSAKIVMDNLVANKMAVGDRVTTAVGTSVINGAILFPSGFVFGKLLVKIVMDDAVATKMAIGDRITITAGDTPQLMVDFVNSQIATVFALNPDGDNANEFTLLIPPSLGPGTKGLFFADNATLSISSELNREVVTVSALNPDGDNTKEFSLTKAVGIRDNATLSFSNQMNFTFECNNVYSLLPGMRVYGANATAAQRLEIPSIKDYLVETVVNEGDINEFKTVNSFSPAINSRGAIPVITTDGTTKVTTITQTGLITLSEQINGVNANQAVKSLAFGEEKINSLTGWEIELSDLKLALSNVSTTTTSAPSAATTFNVTSAVGIADDISTVSGVGINVAAANPTVTAITNVGGATWDNSGQATLTVSSAQTLESGATLTFTGASTVVTLTGNVKVIKAGNINAVLQLRTGSLLTQQ